MSAASSTANIFAVGCAYVRFASLSTGKSGRNAPEGRCLQGGGGPLHDPGPSFVRPSLATGRTRSKTRGEVAVSAYARRNRKLAPEQCSEHCSEHCSELLGRAAAPHAGCRAA